MGIRRVNFIEGEYYHIYNRGNSKQDIFLSDKDYNRFVQLLYLCNSHKPVNFRDEIASKKLDPFDYDKGDSIVSIGAWVLMPNHFHLYITIPKGRSFGDDGEHNSISLFLKKVCTSYTMYFNKKYNRAGALFENRFKATYISNENQAKYLFSYIHLNPIKLIKKDWKENGLGDIDKTLKFLRDYKWGSYQDYINIDRNEKKVLDRDNFLNYFNKIEDFNREILDWIENKDDMLPQEGSREVYLDKSGVIKI